MSYRYRLWGINWLPLLGFAAGTLCLWSYLKYYDVSAVEELKQIQWKLLVQVGGWLVLWRALYCGWFKARFAYYLLWSFIVLAEIGTSVYRHDGLRFILSLFLGVMLYASYVWIEAVLEKAQVNPGLQWFEGKLAQIPRVEAEIQIENQEFKPAGLRRVDEEGAFVLLGTLGSVFSKKTPIKLKLKFKSVEVIADARPVSTLYWEESGIGLQFFFDDLYHQTQYTKFVQQLKGEGLA